MELNPVLYIKEPYYQLIKNSFPSHTGFFSLPQKGRQQTDVSKFVSLENSTEDFQKLLVIQHNVLSVS